MMEWNEWEYNRWNVQLLNTLVYKNTTNTLKGNKGAKLQNMKAHYIDESLLKSALKLNRA